MLEEKLNLAKKHISNGEYEEVIKLLKPLLQEYPDNMEIRTILTEAQEGIMLRLQLSQKIKQAQDYINQNDLENAKKVLDSVLKVDPLNPEAQRLKRILTIPKETPIAETVAFDYDEKIFDEGSKVKEESDFILKEDIESSDFLATTESSIEFQNKEENLGDMSKIDEFDSLDAFELDNVDVKEEEETKKDEDLETFNWEELGGDEFSVEEQEKSEEAQLEGVSFPESVGFKEEFEGEETKLSSEAPSFFMGGEDNKIENLLIEGRRLIGEQKYQEALDVLTRVFILDEENKEAQFLIDEAKTKLLEKEREVNLIMTEAISAFDNGNLERAKELLNKVLLMVPGHKEAEYYLSEIEKRGEEEKIFGESKEEEQAFSTFEVFESFTPIVEEKKEEVVFDVPVDKALEKENQVVTPVTPFPKKVVPKKVETKKRLPVGLIALVIGGLILLGGGFFLVPLIWEKFFSPKPVALNVPKEIPKPKKEVLEEKNIQNRTEVDQKPVVRTLQDILLEANKAMQDKQYDKAVNLYTEADRIAKTDLEIKSKLEAAKQALQKQQEEEARIQKFVNDYEKAVKYFKMSEWAEAVRIAWRLIYPAEQEKFAIQMGKADDIKKIIRNGYYNQAVKDLKSGNLQLARNNLQDLIEFDRSDSQARELKGFVEKYLKSPIDEAYKEKVEKLSYRKIEE